MPIDLAAFDHAINAHTALRTTAIRWADEGKDGYDCKGMVWLKAQALHADGIPWDQMSVLIVRNTGSAERHAVLDVGGQVLDNLSPYINKPTDYDVVMRQPVLTFVVGYALNPERK